MRRTLTNSVNFYCRYENYLKPGLKLGVQWTAAETARLKQAVSEEAPGKWVDIARRMPGRTDAECRQQWQKVATKAELEQYEDKVTPRRP